LRVSGVCQYDIALDKRAHGVVSVVTSSLEDIVVLGSTGSIGISALEVISRHPDRFRVAGLTAFSNVEQMFQQCLVYKPVVVVMVEPRSAEDLAHRIKAKGLDIEVKSGEDELPILSAGAADTIVCGIVGAAGLMSTIAAVKSGKKVLVANKEPLVMMGDHIMQMAHENDAVLLPLDSEHNAIFQCLPQQAIIENKGRATITEKQGIKKILLTASGGPFRLWPAHKLVNATPEQACAHPNWSMGKKISVDSATLMNKGLELIEACAIFGVEAKDVEIVLHPQSIIHSMVEYIDGTILAQMGSPDMRVPIANALGWPDRIESGATRLSVTDIARFDFEKPDYDRFPALRLAEQAAKQGGTLPAILNAANEIAVEAFLNLKIDFQSICKVVENTMNEANYKASTDLESVIEADHQSRLIAEEWVNSFRLNSVS
jgi:1-deoxy-D-xylulose-5-phosphate reductoisomerase